MCRRVIQVRKLPAEPSARSGLNDALQLGVWGFTKGVAKGQVWMEMSLVWHLCHLGNLLAFHQHLCLSVG